MSTFFFRSFVRLLVCSFLLTLKKHKRLAGHRPGLGFPNVTPYQHVARCLRVVLQATILVDMRAAIVFLTAARLTVCFVLMEATWIWPMLSAEAATHGMWERTTTTHRIFMLDVIASATSCTIRTIFRHTRTLQHRYRFS